MSSWDKVLRDAKEKKLRDRSVRATEHKDVFYLVEVIVNEKLTRLWLTKDYSRHDGAEVKAYEEARNGDFLFYASCKFTDSGKLEILNKPESNEGTKIPKKQLHSAPLPRKAESSGPIQG